jgi:hypothetical protein
MKGAEKAKSSASWSWHLQPPDSGAAACNRAWRIAGSRRCARKGRRPRSQAARDTNFAQDYVPGEFAGCKSRWPGETGQGVPSKSPPSSAFACHLRMALRRRPRLSLVHPLGQDPLGHLHQLSRANRERRRGQQRLGCCRFRGRLRSFAGRAVSKVVQFFWLCSYAGCAAGEGRVAGCAAGEGRVAGNVDPQVVQTNGTGWRGTT